MGRAWHGRAVARGRMACGRAESCKCTAFKSRANCPACTGAFAGNTSMTYNDMAVTKLAEPLRRDWGVSPRQTTAARASPPDWPRRGEGGFLGQWGWGSEKAGMEGVWLLYYNEYSDMVLTELAEPLRRDWGVSPRGNSLRSRLAPRSAEEGRRGIPRPMGLGLGKRRDESHMPIVLYVMHPRRLRACAEPRRAAARRGEASLV